MTEQYAIDVDTDQPKTSDSHAITSSLSAGTRGSLLAGISILAACADPAPVPSRKNPDGGLPAGDGSLDPRCGCMTGGTPATGTTPATPATPAAPLPAFVGGRHFRFVGSGTTIGVNMMANNALSGGASIPVWSFTDQTGSLPGFNADRAAPGPVIEVTEGQLASLTLSSGMPHSIHWHGLDVDQANDGVPATSGYVGNAPPLGNFGRVGNYTSLGTQKTYQFNAPHAGTYMYHCHVDSVLHVEMGMAGTVIVRPASGNVNELWTGGPVFQREYIWQLHTFDASWHSGMPMTMVSGPSRARYQPDTFLINGRNGPDLLTDETTAIAATAGETVLIRAVNIGYQPASINLGNIPFQVVASDGRPLPTPLTSSGLTIFAGERYDLLLTMPTLATAVNANVDYLDIRNRNVLGTATTTISNL